MKVVRKDSIGSMGWNDDGTNDWNKATLQLYLNTGEYYTGLSQGVKDKIAMVEWNLGGYNNNQIYSNDVYKEERSEVKCSSCTYNTIWEGNIALMYPSDYVYGADLTSCFSVLSNYSTCIGVNWLFIGESQWFLTPYSSDQHHAWLVRHDGYVGIDYYVLNTVEVLPVLYLDSSQNIIYGNGTENNPYVIE